MTRKRSFGRTNQSHGCAPAMPLDDAFADRPELRPIHLAVLKTLRKVADVRPRPRMAYFVDLRTTKDVDREVRDWLAEAYFSSPEQGPA